MRHPIFLSVCFFCLFLSCIPQISAQSEFGVRALFFQNDFVTSPQSVELNAQGPHAGEWQFGLSWRKYFADHFAGRFETNLTRGKYRLTNKRFSYLAFCAIPEWRVSSTVFLGAGGFVNLRLSDPNGTQKNSESGILANVAFRHKRIEIQCRAQKWLNPVNKFTLGAGIDVYLGRKYSK